MRTIMVLLILGAVLIYHLVEGEPSAENPEVVTPVTAYSEYAISTEAETKRAESSTLNGKELALNIIVVCGIGVIAFAVLTRHKH